MLTIKAPITLKCNAAMIPSYEAFYHRIAGNYELLAADITKEDLFHVVVAPPEVYLAEGGMTSIVNSTRVSSQEMKLNVINNLLNRLTLSGEANLTYQDRVYITDALTRLGIENVSQFMSQVTKLKQEADTTERLINVYWNHMEDLTRVVREYRAGEPEARRAAKSGGEKADLHLHEEIMNRLQTGAIYQILSNFYSNYGGKNSYIINQEMRIMEQRRTAENILLNQLRNVVQNTDTPLIHRHENYYENIDLEEREVNDEYVSRQIASATLLNLVDNLYLNRLEKSFGSYTAWLHMEDSFYLSAENTIRRFQNIADHYYDLRSSREYASYQQRIEEQELFSLIRILEPGVRTVESLILDHAPLPSPEEGMDERVEESVERYLEIVKLPQLMAPPLSAPEARAVYRQLPPEPDQAKRAEGETIPEPEGEERLIRQRESVERILERESESLITREQIQIPEEFPEAQMGHIRNEDAEEEDFPDRSELRERETQTVPAEAGRRTIEEIRRIEQRSTENIERFRQIVAAREEQQVRIFRAEEKRPAGEEIISHPEPEEEEGQLPVTEEESRRIEEIHRIDQKNTENIERIRQITAAREEQQERIFRTEREEPAEEEIISHLEPEGEEAQTPPGDEEARMIEELRRINQKNIENLERYRQILAVREEGQARRVSSEPPVERIRRESLIALENPQQLFEEFRQERQERVRRDDRQMERIAELLPEQTRKLYELTIQKRDHPEQFAAQENIPLVHKPAENVINEEILEQLAEQNRLVSSRTQVTEKAEEEREVTNITRVIHEENRQTLLQEEQDINEMIRRGVQSQVGILSDQIYSRLERRLQNEKKRRGF